MVFQVFFRPLCKIEVIVNYHRQRRWLEMECLEGTLGNI